MLSTILLLKVLYIYENGNKSKAAYVLEYRTVNFIILKN